MKPLIFIALVNITVKDSKYANINSVNPLYLIINEVDGYVEEINGNKYLILGFYK